MVGFFGWDPLEDDYRSERTRVEEAEEHAQEPKAEPWQIPSDRVHTSEPFDPVETSEESQ